MIIKLHEDNHIQSGVDSAFIESIRVLLPYRGAALTLESVQKRIDSGIKLDVYKYEIVNGEIIDKGGDPFFLMDPEWKQPVFNSDSGIIQWDDRAITPDDDITGVPDYVQKFCNALWDNGIREVWELIKQRDAKRTELKEFNNA